LTSRLPIEPHLRFAYFHGAGADECETLENPEGVRFFPYAEGPTATAGKSVRD
jgi:hypothetical protein